MASTFKIPKRKQSLGSDSTHLPLPSPLLRLQDSAPECQSYGGVSSRAGTDRTGPAPSTSAHRWRPDRASDRLLQLELQAPPPQKKKAAGQSEVITVVALDPLAELRGEVVHAGRGGPGPAHRSPEASSSKTRTRPWIRATASPRAMGDRRRSLDRRAGLMKVDVQEEEGERERRRWKEFNQRKEAHRKHPPVEPIVLSSEEDDADGAKRIGQSSRRGAEPNHSRPEQTQARQGENDLFLQLKFSSLHAGPTHAVANGNMMVTESGITLPLTGVDPGEVVVVASQLRGYGVWDGGVVRGGALLEGHCGPAPSLLFLWVTEAQARLLQMELSAIIEPSCGTGPACCFLLVVLQEQLQELQAALLASILDMEEYRRARSPSSSSALIPASPLDWTTGLLLLHSCPPPLDQQLLHLLGLSGESNETRSQRSRRTILDSSSWQQLPSMLIQFPLEPCKGRITVTKEDLACLDPGEFLNDVIIDFYLKFLLLEGGAVAQRTHIFSSFFYKHLSGRTASRENQARPVLDRHSRHQRVKTWTRNVDIFTKDFLFVPVNQEAHWFLVVVCFPGLEQLQYHKFQQPGEAEQAVGRRSPSPPECSEHGCRRDSVLRRPCVLVMDSLKLSNHDSVCRLIREYLQVEWEVRRGTPRVFSSSSFRSSSCQVPQQNNSSDCGVYLLQYAHSFLQNPVVHFDLPPRLERWFPRQQVQQKRDEIRTLILRLHREQSSHK